MKKPKAQKEKHPIKDDSALAIFEGLVKSLGYKFVVVECPGEKKKKRRKS